MNDIKQINIADVIGNHVDLKKSGSRLVGLCPFHDEKTPSFFVFDNRYKCFGCGETGDVADFIQKITGCDFQGALKHLGLKSGYVSQEALERKKYEKQLIKDFKEWCFKAEAGLACICFRIDKTLFEEIQTWQDLDDYGYLYHRLEKFQYWREILAHGSDKDKYDFYKDHRWLQECFLW